MYAYIYIYVCACIYVMVVIKPCPFIPKLIKVLFQLKSSEYIILNTRGENRQGKGI